MRPDSASPSLRLRVLFPDLLTTLRLRVTFFAALLATLRLRVLFAALLDTLRLRILPTDAGKSEAKTGETMAMVAARATKMVEEMNFMMNNGCGCGGRCEDDLM